MQKTPTFFEKRTLFSQVLRGSVLVSTLAALIFSVAFTSFAAEAGDLDAAFGSSGIVTVDFGGVSDFGTDLAIQTDGKIVVVGRMFDGATDNFAIVRVLNTGALDTTFGTDGKVTTDFNNSFDGAEAVALQSDGKIVVAGYTDSGGTYDFALVRYNIDGTLDETFGSAGKVVTDFSTKDDYAYDLTLDNNGKIIVVGLAAIGNDSYYGIARYNTDGTLDLTFDADGKITYTIYGYANRADAVIVDGNNKILVGGMTRWAGGNEVGILRMNNDGSLDTTFSGDGKVVFDYSGDAALDLKIDPAGKIVFAVDGNSRFQAGRLNNNGTLDTSFSGDGMAVFPVSNSDVSRAILVQPDGKIILGGESLSNNRDFTLMRLNYDGTLDTTFSFDGIAKTPAATGHDAIYGLAHDADGNIVAAGFSANGINNNFAIARYLSVSIPKPGAFNLISPAQRILYTEGNVPSPLTFSWSPSSNSTHYALTIRKGSALSPIVVSKTNLTTTSYALDTTEQVQVIGAGDYYWTVVAYGNGGATSASGRFFSVGSLLVTNSGFEAGIDGWNLKNPTKDKLKCDKPEKNKYFAYSGECAFMFKGGANENSKLIYKPSLAGKTFATNDTLRLSLWANVKNSTNLKYKLVVKHANNQKSKIDGTLTNTSEYLYLLDYVDLINGNVSNIKLTIVNKSASGKAFIDDVQLVHIGGSSSLLGLESATDAELLPLPASND